MAFGLFVLIGSGGSAAVIVAGLLGVGLISFGLSFEFARRWRNCE